MLKLNELLPYTELTLAKAVKEINGCTRENFYELKDKFVELEMSGYHEGCVIQSAFEDAAERLGLETV